MSKNTESNDVHVSEAAKDAIGALATALNRYDGTSKKVIGSLSSLGAELSAFGSELARPSPKLVNGWASIVNGLADIGAWFVDVIEFVRPIVGAATTGMRDGLDAAGVPNEAQASNMLHEAIRNAQVGGEEAP